MEALGTRKDFYGGKDDVFSLGQTKFGFPAAWHLGIIWQMLESLSGIQREVEARNGELSAETGVEALFDSAS